MNLNEEQIREIEEMAALFLSPEDIAINLEYNEEQAEDFVSGVVNKQTGLDIVAAYFKGRLTAEIELRRSIKQSANNGSNPAQQMMLNFEKESRK